MGSLEHNMTVNKKTKSQNKAKNEKVGTTKRNKRDMGWTGRIIFVIIVSALLQLKTKNKKKKMKKRKKKKVVKGREHL
jgi:hypothetical protein